MTAAVWFWLFAASGYGVDRKFLLGGMLPVVTVFGACAITVGVVSLFTSPPPSSVLARFFPPKST